MSIVPRADAIVLLITPRSITGSFYRYFTCIHYSSFNIRKTLAMTHLHQYKQLYIGRFLIATMWAASNSTKFNLQFVWSPTGDLAKHCTFHARSILPIVLSNSSKRDRLLGVILESCSRISKNFKPLLTSSAFPRGIKSWTANFRVSKSSPEIFDDNSTRNFL